MPLIWVTYFGEVNIAYWEWLMAVLYVLVIYIYFARRKNVMLKHAPEYRFYLWGLIAKLTGAVAFSLIYFYYYGGGDTTAYFYSGVAMRNLAVDQPLAYLHQLFGDNSTTALQAYTNAVARPLAYVFTDPRTFQVVRISSVLALLTFKSYLVSTLLLASLSFFGIWACFRTFVGYFPQLTGRLAVAFLFMPSTLFWGSAILKDTITFSAVCFWVHAVDELFFKRRNDLRNIIVLFISAYFMVAVKPYIFMLLMPATLLWLFYFRIVRMRNVMVKFVVVPVAFLGLFALSIYVLNSMGDSLGKFSLADSLQTIQVTQEDLSSNVSYGSHSFNVGAVDDSWSSVLKKFPMATNAALFRPYLWESDSFTMIISGVENMWVLGLTLLVLWRAGPRFAWRCIASNPLLLMCTVFVIAFAFMVGITTPNFGALVRFRIPMVPFFISGLFIVDYFARLRRSERAQGRPFDLKRFRMGTAALGVEDPSRAGRKGRRWR